MNSNNILIVEDDYLDIMSVERALKKLNVSYTLNVAHNGVDALALLNGTYPGKEKLRPDIILLDINMPKMDGAEFLRIVKNYFTLNNIRIFITTTSGEDHDILSFRQLGVDGYILKPLDFNTQVNAQATDSSKLMTALCGHN